MTTPVQINLSKVSHITIRDVNDGPSLHSVIEERMQKALAKSFEETAWAMMTAASRHRPQRPTALRVAPSGHFETVELDAAGNVIEPPPRCHCVVIHRADCPNRFLVCT